MAATYAAFTQFQLNSVRYDFHPSSLMGRRDEFTDANGLRGTLARSIERNLPGIYRVNGQVKFFPTPTELTTLLPIVYGTAVSTITYALAESATGYTAIVDRGAKVHTYAAVKAARSRFHCGGHNQALGFDVDFVGTTESEGASGSFGSLSVDVATKPWMFHQMTMTIDGTTVTPRSYELIVDCGFDTERFFNSQTLSTGANWTDMNIGINVTIPYGDQSTIYTSSALNTGVQVVVTFTNGVYILTQTLVKVAFKRDAPQINDRGEVFLTLQGQAMKSSSTRELVTTLAIS